MELLIQIILLSALMKYCLKAAGNASLKAMGGYVLFVLLWPFALYPIMINLPVNIVSELLKERSVVSDCAVVVTVESVAGILLSLKLLENYFRPKMLRSRLLATVKVMPGVLSLAAMAYFELLFFRIRAGSPFLSTVALYSGLLAAAVFVASYLLKLLLPGESVKLELKMLLNLFILAVALSVNSAVSGYPSSNASASVDYGAFAAIASVFAIFALSGFMAEKYCLGKRLRSFLGFVSRKG